MGSVEQHGIPLPPLTRGTKVNNKRIHEHDWENGICRICQAREQPNVPDRSAQNRQELMARLQSLEKRVAQLEGLTPLAFIAFFVWLLLFRKC
jgi:hypothetical protein